MISRKKLIIYSLSLVLILGIFVAYSRVNASGYCVQGYAYRDVGTEHNYVEFRPNFSIDNGTNWQIYKPWYAFSLGIWSYPNQGSYGTAGIHGTDGQPWYSASVYQMCAN